MSTQTGVDTEKQQRFVAGINSGECPLRGIARRVPARHVKKSLFTIYLTVMMDVFSHSSWNGW